MLFSLPNDIFRGLKNSVVSSRISYDDHLSETNYTSNALLTFILPSHQITVFLLVFLYVISDWDLVSTD